MTDKLKTEGQVKQKVAETSPEMTGVNEDDWLDNQHGIDIHG